jgi:hypothetical protein
MIVERDKLVRKYITHLASGICSCKFDFKEVYKSYLRGMKEIQKYDR